MLFPLWFSAVIGVPIAVVTVVLDKWKEKQRKTKELKQLQKDEEARRLEAERRAEEKRRIEETARLQEERTKRERKEREQRQAEEIRGRNEAEAMCLQEEKRREQEEINRRETARAEQMKIPHCDPAVMALITTGARGGESRGGPDQPFLADETPAEPASPEQHWRRGTERRKSSRREDRRGGSEESLRSRAEECICELADIVRLLHNLACNRTVLSCH